MQINQWKTHPNFPLADNSSVRGCREFVLGPGESTCTHSHAEFQEIHLILDGTGEIAAGKETRAIKAGELIFVSAGETHQIRNTSNSALLRGLAVENAVPISMASQPVTVQDLESVIDSIPEELDVSLSLQLIIKLFDMAGYISEQIDHSLGLETESGYEALRDIEKRVMEAVVVISDRYHQGGSFPHSHPRRF
ncbi:MAG: cupin domain-containing protein [Planctomycetota bacterium]